LQATFNPMGIYTQQIPTSLTRVMTLDTQEGTPSFPLISIITVCLNAGAYLEATMQSVFAQTYPNIEYIIVDGGSQDQTLALIEKYNHQITTWVSEKDNGIYEAMNKGIKMANGDSILMLNAGDWLETTAIQKMVETANKQVKDKVICCDWVVFFNQSTHKIQRQATFDFNRKNGICHQGTLIGRDIYRKFGDYDTQWRFVSDYDFYLRVWKGAPSAFVRVPHSLAHFMYEGVTTKRIRESNIERWKVINQHFSWTNAIHIRIVTLGAIVYRTLKTLF
jgi:glycosyltransferase involved in cell wall biosynthesis